MKNEFRDDDRSLDDLWTAFIEWLNVQGDLDGVKTVYENDHRYVGGFGHNGRTVRVEMEYTQ